MSIPARGEVWIADLDPTRGHEQAGRRPILILSIARYNAGPSRQVVAVPITSRVRPLPMHVPIAPPDGGLKVPSAALCDALRSITQERLRTRWGVLAPATLARVEDAVRILLGL